jgi:hypothetical protein
MREVGPNKCQPVKLELEYESKNFLLHMHPLDGCDGIVCWINNWPECPLEVIELRRVVEELRMRKDCQNCQDCQDSRKWKAIPLNADERRKQEELFVWKQRLSSLSFPVISEVGWWVVILRGGCMSKVFVLTAVILVMLSAAGAQPQYTYTFLTFSGANRPQVRGVNSSGQVVGFYFDNFSFTHGFLLKNGTACTPGTPDCVTIDAPGAIDTSLNGVNNSGVAVGFFDVLGRLTTMAL